MLRHVGREHPLVVVFTALCSGILLWFAHWCGAVFCLVILALILSRPRLVHACAGIVLGMAVASLAPAWVEVGEGVHAIQGTVRSFTYDDGVPQVTLTNAVIDGRASRGLVQVKVWGELPPLEPGVRLSSRMRVRRMQGFGNQGEFDYRSYLLSQAIVLSGTIERGTCVHTLTHGKPPGLRRQLIGRFDGMSRPEAEIFKAMLLGDRSGITLSIQDRFNALSLTHLIAISGLNIGIAMMMGYMSVFTLLRLAWPVAVRIDVPLASRVGGICAAFAYTLFVGPEIPTLRAAIMGISVTSSLLILRRSAVLEGLAVSGIIILLVWPRAIFSASFLLSFSAVLGIIGMLEKTETAPRWLSFVWVTLGAGIFVMPLMSYLFGFISWRGFAANTLMVPVFSTIIMPAGITGILMLKALPVASSFLCECCMDIIHLMLEACDRWGELSALPRPWMPWVFCCYGAFVAAFFAAQSRMRTILISILAALIVVIPVARQVHRCSGPLRFDFLSVGQGDCSVITKGAHSVLIDAGPGRGGFDTGRYVVSPHLLGRGIVSLDLVILTHMHPDHTGGIPFILERFPVRQVWVNAIMADNPCFQEVARITKKKSIPLRTVCIGDSIRIGGISIQVLNPQTRLEEVKYRLDQNMQSIVVLAGDTSMQGLFMGDADMFGELVLTHRMLPIRSHVIKAAHHGGPRSCLGPFLEAVKPEIAVISCGYGNTYGDPSPHALSRLRNAGVKTYRTDLQGEIMITYLSKAPHVKSGRKAADSELDGPGGWIAY